MGVWAFLSCLILMFGTVLGRISEVEHGVREVYLRERGYFGRLEGHDAQSSKGSIDQECRARDGPWIVLVIVS